jgi:ketosteroid isomerase-like protein
VREAGDRVVALVRERAVGRASDAVLERELGVVYGFRGGTIARVRMFGSWEAALSQ